MGLVANYNSDSDAEPPEDEEEEQVVVDVPVGSGLASLPAPKKKKVVAFHLQHSRAALTRQVAVRVRPAHDFVARGVTRRASC
jgi:hypothetical protein